MIPLWLSCKYLLRLNQRKSLKLEADGTCIASILEKPCGARRAWYVNKLQVQKDYWLVRNSWGELLVKEF